MMEIVRCIECGFTGCDIVTEHHISCKWVDGYGGAGSPVNVPVGASGGSPKLHGIMYKDAKDINNNNPSTR